MYSCIYATVTPEGQHNGQRRSQAEEERQDQWHQHSWRQHENRPQVAWRSAFWTFWWNLEWHWLVLQPSCSLVSQGSSQGETLSHNLHNGQKAPPTKSPAAKKQAEAAADISKSSRPAGDRRWVEPLSNPVLSLAVRDELRQRVICFFQLLWIGFSFPRLSLQPSVSLKNKKQHQVVASHCWACSWADKPHPPSSLWVYLKPMNNKMCCNAAGFSTSASLEIWWCKMATN